MSFNFLKIDVLGRIVGKARRRELEGQVKLNLTSITKRLTVGAVAAGIAAAAKPDLLGTKSGVLSLVGIGLTAMIPAGAASTGLVTPAQPGSPSAAESLVQSAVNLATGPADKRQAAAAATDLKLQTLIGSQVTATLHEALSEYGPTLAAMAADKVLLKTGQFGPGELGTQAPAPKSETPSAAEAPVDGQAAILGTGGNQ